MVTAGGGGRNSVFFGLVSAPPFLSPPAALLLLACTLLALLEVFRRYLFGHSFEWQQDAVTFFTLCGVFLYFALSQRKDAHLNVMLVPELLAVAGPRGRRPTGHRR